MILRPGPGWKRLGPAVYEHMPTSIRVHTQGCYRRPCGEFIQGAGHWPESRRFAHFVRVCGGNHRRGAMVWALNHWRESARATP